MNSFPIWEVTAGFTDTEFWHGGDLVEPVPLRTRDHLWLWRDGRLYPIADESDLWEQEPGSDLFCRCEATTAEGAVLAGLTLLRLGTNYGTAGLSVWRDDEWHGQLPIAGTPPEVAGRLSLPAGGYPVSAIAAHKFTRGPSKRGVRVLPNGIEIGIADGKRWWAPMDRSAAIDRIAAVLRDAGVAYDQRKDGRRLYHWPAGDPAPEAVLAAQPT